jgi:hypothetical protein
VDSCLIFLFHLPCEVGLRDLQDVGRNMPLVAVDSDFGFECPSVFVNQEFGSPGGNSPSGSTRSQKNRASRGPVLWRAARLRYIGWQKELKKARLPAGPVVDGDWTAESGFKAAVRSLGDRSFVWSGQDLSRLLGSLLVPRLRGTAALQVLNHHQCFDRDLEGVSRRRPGANRGGRECLQDSE